MSKQSGPNSPSISIVTPTFNSAGTLGDCLRSVANQRLSADQIVVDGASSDDTLAIVRAAQREGLQVLSEPDEGVYDGMNKGVALATGEVVGILNSDDYYASPNVLSLVARAFEDPGVDACYGDLVYIAPEDPSRVVRYWRAGPFDRRKFYWGWMPPHPTFFVRRRVYQRLGAYRLDQGSAADYELMLRFLLKHKIHAAYIPEVLVKMRTGGVSNVSLRNRLRANRMDRRAWHANGLRPYPWTLAAKPLRKLGQWFAHKPQ